MEFTLERPPGFEFRAGQALELRLVSPLEADPRGNGHIFSLASAPSEPLLRVASRMRDTAYKRSLHSLLPGALVELEGPYGSFTLHEDRTRAAVMLAGGIGVTPFLSMVLEALREPGARELWLFYSNRRPEDFAYLEELREWAAGRAGFRVVATITRPDASHAGWDGERGRISRELLKRYVRGGRPVYYAAGPPGFVEAMRDVLPSGSEARTEEFSGY